MQGYLYKNSGGKKSNASASSVPRRRSSFGNALPHWDRRFFMLTSDSKLCYYKKEADMLAGKVPAGDIDIRDAMVSVLQRETAFCIETRQRILALRAETDAERATWVAALLDSGARDHPLEHQLAAIPLSERSLSDRSVPIAGAYGRDRGVSAPPSVSNTAAGSVRMSIPVPAGLQSGQQFEVEAPSGERFNVTVPSGAAQQVEVVVPARCLPTQQTQQHLTDGLGHSGPATVSLDSTAAAPSALPTASSDLELTLCRRFQVTLAFWPAAKASLGMMLCPSKTNHLIITDIQVAQAQQKGEARQMSLAEGGA